MRYYIAADGGGTKLQVILYNEDLEIINTAKSTGTNFLFKPKSDVEKEIDKLTEKLIPKSITEIEAVDLMLVGGSRIFIDAVSSRCTVNNISYRGEGATPLAASGYLYGITAQAGTGSDAFMVQPDDRFLIGGWGAVLGDEGGGYDIGLNSLKAAIYSFDGRGENTLLYDLIMEEWKLSSLWDLVSVIHNDPDYRRLVASVSYITEKAAKMGDQIALRIYENAAHAMSLQVFAAINRYGGNWTGPIVTSGGAWKGSRHMFDTFSKDIRNKYPEAEIMFPVFEPVIGCIVLRMCEKDEGFINKFDKNRASLEEIFKDYLYRKSF